MVDLYDKNDPYRIWRSPWCFVALCRFRAYVYFFDETFPWGTLVVNLCGSFLIGILGPIGTHNLLTKAGTVSFNWRVGCLHNLF